MFLLGVYDAHPVYQEPMPTCTAQIPEVAYGMVWKTCAAVLHCPAAGNAGLRQLLCNHQDIIDDVWCESEGRLVEDEKLRLTHECAGDGHHLLLTTGKGTGDLSGSLLQLREPVVALLEIVLEVLLQVLVKSAELEVLEAGHAGEELTALRHLYDPAVEDDAGVLSHELLIIEDDGACRWPDHPGKCTNRGGLTGTVRSEDRDDLTISDFEGLVPDDLQGAIACC